MLSSSLIFQIILLLLFYIILSIHSRNKRIQREEYQRQEQEIEERRINSIMNNMIDNGYSISINSFMDLVKSKDRSKIVSKYSFTGIYILFNTNKQKHYIGQSGNVFQRVNAHFSGRGSLDIYADYKYGDIFSAILIPLTNTKYDSLNDLEKDMIKKYNSNITGYNLNRGNRR